MHHPFLSPTPATTLDLDEAALLAALAAVLAQVRTWHHLRAYWHARFVHDFPTSAAAAERYADTLNHVQVLAHALRAVADQLDTEVADTTDRFYTWLTD